MQQFRIHQHSNSTAEEDIHRPNWVPLNIIPPTIFQLVRRLTLRTIRTINQLCNTFFCSSCTTQFKLARSVTKGKKVKKKSSPLRNAILVVDAWDRICPPMGFIAPPGAKLRVAPGSAIWIKKWITGKKWKRKRLKRTLDLVGEDYSDLGWVRQWDQRRKSSGIKGHTLYSSASLVSFWRCWANWWKICRSSSSEN